MKHETKKPRAVAGVAWYRPEQWRRLREISEDADKLEEKYEDWLREAERIVANKDLGPLLVKVDVDTEQLLIWCRDRQLQVNSQSRARYVADTLRRRDLK